MSAHPLVLLSSPLVVPPRGASLATSLTSFDAATTPDTTTRPRIDLERTPAPCPTDPRHSLQHLSVPPTSMQTNGQWGEVGDFLDMDDDEREEEEEMAKHSKTKDKPHVAVEVPPSHNTIHIPSSHTHSVDPASMRTLTQANQQPSVEVGASSQAHGQLLEVDNISAVAPEFPLSESYSPRTNPIPPSGMSSIFRELPLLPSDLETTRVAVVHSSMKSNDRGKEVLSSVIEVNPGSGKAPWKVEKLYSDVLGLDHRVRISVGKGMGKKMAVLPEGKIWRDHAPSKSDQRKAGLEAYLQSLVNLPVKDKNEIIAFLTSNVVRDTYKPVIWVGHKEGYLMKRGKNFGRWKSRYFVLQGPVLEYYESRGGAHLGSIVITAAQIGRQQRTADNDDEGNYRHALLIIEAKKGPSESHSRHVLCAESDAERDSWVDILVRYTSGTFNEKTLEDDKEELGEPINAGDLDVSHRNTIPLREIKDIPPDIETPSLSCLEVDATNPFAQTEDACDNPYDNFFRSSPSSSPDPSPRRGLRNIFSVPSLFRTPAMKFIRLQECLTGRLSARPTPSDLPLHAPATNMQEGPTRKRNVSVGEGDEQCGPIADQCNEAQRLEDPLPDSPVEVSSHNDLPYPLKFDNNQDRTLWKLLMHLRYKDGARAPAKMTLDLSPEVVEVSAVRLPKLYVVLKRKHSPKSPTPTAGTHATPPPAGSLPQADGSSHGNPLCSDTPLQGHIDTSIVGYGYQSPHAIGLHRTTSDSGSDWSIRGPCNKFFSKICFPCGHYK